MDKISTQDHIDQFERWANDIVDLIPAGIYRSNIEGNIVYCNRFFCRMLGFRSPDEMIGYSIVNAYRNKKDRGKFIKILLEKGYVHDLSLSLQKKDGTPIWCAVTARAVFDDEETLLFIDGVIRDITLEHSEDKSAVIAPIPKDRMNLEKFRGVLEMAGGVSHKINQPLMIINNLLNEVLSDIREDDSHSRKLEMVRNQLVKLNEIAEKIRGIEKYVTMEYVGGLKIVDIDRSAALSSGENK
jgi:PAS domain S-box-containing protein